MMDRVCEPELMDDPAQARAYDAADFEQPHASFVELLGDRLADLPATGRAVDLGCGPGDITLRFARRFPGWSVTGIDGAGAMLALAGENAARAGLADRVDWIQQTLPAEGLLPERFDAAISNSLLHHLHDPQVLWSTLRGLLVPGAAVFVMDLRRPPTPAEAARLVDEYAREEPELLRRDFYHSLCAAFTPQEVEAQLAQAGLTGLRVEVVSDRHLIIHGYPR